MKKYKPYGTKELVTWLKCLGYKTAPQVGSSHWKFNCPNEVSKGQRSFIIVVQNRSKYDPIWQKEYPKQIRKHGFSEDAMEKCFPK